MQFNLENETKLLEKFLKRWPDRHSNLLTDVQVDSDIANDIATFIELAVTKFTEQTPKIENLDRHKISAIRSKVLRRTSKFIFHRGGKQLKKNELKDLTSFLCVDAFVLGLPNCNKKSFFSAPVRKRDLKFVFTHGKPTILSLSMIGYYVERDFPKEEGAQTVGVTGLAAEAAAK